MSETALTPSPSHPPPLRAIPRLIARVRARLAVPRFVDPINDTPDAEIAAGRLVQQRSTTGRLYARVGLIRLFLVLGGLGWLLALPLEQLGRRTFVDEHAIQPGQVTTTWSWGDVHKADVYLGNLERLWERNATSEEKSEYISTELRKLGIPAGTQEYSFNSPSVSRSGINTYALLSPPRSGGTESLLLSIPSRSLTGGPNLRGLALGLALARFLRGQNHWAKDIVLVWADGGAEGVEAFLRAYHGVGGRGWKLDDLELAPQGVIWQALNIDYPGHSYSHLGIYYEGFNGRLPNQDLVNTLTHIARWTGQSPVRLYNREAELRDTPCPRWLPVSACRPLQYDAVRSYVRAAGHLGEHFWHAALGSATGAHGVYARYRIDAVTLFAVPATGPHGFHALGITLESSLRSLNNILERLHASFFFYTMQHPDRFLQIGSYLPAAIILSASLTIGGLALWVDAGWAVVEVQADPRGRATLWMRKERSAGQGVLLLAGCFAVGVATLAVAERQKNPGWAIIAIKTTVTALVLLVNSTSRPIKALRQPAPRLATAGMAHIVAGAATACLAMVNFPQATVLTLLLLPTLGLSELAVRNGRGASSRPLVVAASIPVVLALMAGYLGKDMARSYKTLWTESVLEWQILGSRLLPLALLLYWPLELVTHATI